jgi:thioredoxin reductase
MNQQPENIYDAVIIGGSFAGLSAAMSLGRSLRKTMIIDSGNPCNWQTPHAHNLLTHDGSTPAEITLKAREQVLSYPTVQMMSGKAVQATQETGHFMVMTESGTELKARKILFATGVKDIMPDIPGFAACWGISVLHCPYCHGYEVRGSKTAILANGDAAYESVKMISHWTSDLVLLTNGPSELSSEQADQLKKHHVKVIEKEISEIEHQDGMMQQVVFKDGETCDFKAMYAKPHFTQHSDLPELLGCRISEHDLLEVDTFHKTNIPGVYAAGDCTSWGRAISMATSAGAVAGMFINKELVDEDFER